MPDEVVGASQHDEFNMVAKGIKEGLQFINQDSYEGLRQPVNGPDQAAVNAADS
jgi:hypothetical protein